MAFTVKSRRARSCDDVVDEVHRVGTAPVGVRRLAAQRRDLVVLTVHDDGDRAVLEPGRDHPREELHQLVRQRVGRDVPVGDRLAEERVAHAAADDPRALPRAAEALADAEGVLGDVREVERVKSHDGKKPDQRRLKKTHRPIQSRAKSGCAEAAVRRF